MAHDPAAMAGGVEVEDMAFEAFVRKARDSMPEPALQDQVGRPPGPSAGDPGGAAALPGPPCGRSRAPKESPA